MKTNKQFSEVDKSIMDESYEKVRKLIVKIVYDFARKNLPVPLEDICSEADLMFLKAYKTYNPEKSKFSTWVTNVIWSGLMDLRKKQCTQRNKRPRTWNIDFDSYSEPVARKPSEFEMGDLLKELSPEAKEVVEIALNPPQEIHEAACSRVGGWTPYNFNLSLRKHFKNLGWKKRLVTKLFREIKKTLYKIS